MKDSIKNKPTKHMPAPQELLKNRSDVTETISLRAKQRTLLTLKYYASQSNDGYTTLINHILDEYVDQYPLDDKSYIQIERNYLFSRLKSDIVKGVYKRYKGPMSDLFSEFRGEYDEFLESQKYEPGDFMDDGIWIDGLMEKEEFCRGASWLINEMPSVFYRNSMHGSTTNLELIYGINSFFNDNDNLDGSSFGSWLAEEADITDQLLVFLYFIFGEELEFDKLCIKENLTGGMLNFKHFEAFTYDYVLDIDYSNSTGIVSNGETN